jgi:arsenite methyltransferase
MILRRLAVVPIIVILAVAAPMRTLAQEHEPSAHHGFSDVQHWLKVFESPERDRWQKPDEVVKAMGLKPGETVVDIGAGTGYFTRRFAAAVAPNGRAIGLDVELGMVEQMKKDAAARGLKNYEARVVKPDDAGLANDSVDVIFLCDTFHHIENRPAYFRKLIPAFRPGGRLVIVDFHKRELPIGPPPAHKVSRAQIVTELREAGYKLVASRDFLPYQNFLEFAPASPPSPLP